LDDQRFLIESTYMSIKTLVTADDFGFSQNINRAIIEAYEKGRVTELSVMIDSFGTDEAVKYIKENDVNNFGLHFSLCRVSRDGRMFREYDETLANWSSEKLCQAFDEEINLFVQKFGVVPKHVIGHKQIALHPKLIDHVANYCQKNDCFARSYVKHATLQKAEVPDGLVIGRTTDEKFTFRYGNPEQMYAQYKTDITEAKKRHQFDSAEFVFHPGYASDFERPLTSFIQERNDDINFLLSDNFAQLIKEEDLILVPSIDIK